MLEELVNGLDTDGQNLLVLPCDVSKEGDVDAAVKPIAEYFGRLDVLVNNAGITRDALTLKFRDGELVSRMSLEDWQAVIDVNLTGVFLCGRAAAEQMIPAGRIGDPDEISHTAQYLVENDFVNGRNVEVDGALRISDVAGIRRSFL